MHLDLGLKFQSVVFSEMPVPVTQSKNLLLKDNQSFTFHFITVSFAFSIVGACPRGKAGAQPELVTILLQGFIQQFTLTLVDNLDEPLYIIFMLLCGGRRFKHFE